GPRAVEEYRLYYLANGHQLAGDPEAARTTLAALWRRKPRLTYASDVAFTLAGLYTARGDFSAGADVFATLASRAEVPAVAASARWQAARARAAQGDLAGAIFDARQIAIEHPAAAEAKEAAAFLRNVSGLDARAPIPMTSSERFERAVALRTSGNAQDALGELAALGDGVPHLAQSIQLEKGLALHALRRYEDSSAALEPLTSGVYKVAIPALRTAARNYTLLAAAINPEVIRTVKERKRVGTEKVRVGKGKKRKTVTRPKYRIVTRQVKRVDLAKKKKKEEYERLAGERLRDLQLLPLDDDLRLDVLNTLIARAQAKNQTEYLQELVPQAVKIDPLADPALQHFWDKAWAAYTRGDLRTARPLFRFIAGTYAHTNVRRQSDYWYARCLDRMGQKEEARAIYQKLASAPYADLYAHHAVSRGAKREAPKTNPLEKDGPDWAEVAAKEMPQELVLAWELTALSAMRDAYTEIRRNARRENTRYAEALLADYYAAAGNEVLMYRALRRAWPQLATVDQDSVPAYFIRLYYPLKYGDEIERHAKARNLDPSLVRALILQESYYNPRARSSVGATGLMQLMPPTAKEHAARLRIPFAVSRLENPDVNVNLGTFHLRMLVNLFKGNTYLAVASYNAGQGNVLKWRRAAPNKPLDELLESIPFPETRNYVKRVTMLRSAYERMAL
ncbi:MAG TPA: transglycosylase SLT domain-containing protein, partial [Thermoanaerobaculia bacterium]|nr:transglycosylase SLT domain-containing protein [Thermoanaerobaculia bacterium]